MGAITVSHLAWRLPGGDELFQDVGFRVGNGERTAIIGANGVGKTTLLKLITGDTRPSTGTITIDGQIGVMHQLVGTASHPARTVSELLVSLAPSRLQDAAVRLRLTESHLADDPMAYADALAAWGDAGGYDLEVAWSEYVTRALGEDFNEVRARQLRTFSGGEQKRLALEALLRSEFDILILDEPDNFLDVPGKRWLERELNDTRKTVLFISHDRELLAATATKIVTIEAWGAWTHGGSFATYAEAKMRQTDKREHDRSVYDDEQRKLEELVAEMRRRAKISEVFAPKLKAAETRLRHFVEKNERPPDVREQVIDVRLRGARTGKRAVICEQVELDGLTDPFDLELWYGERVAVLGGNGVGKSHFLRLLDTTGRSNRTPPSHSGVCRLGAGVVAGLFHQTHEHPEWFGRPLADILHDHDVVLGPAMGMLRRYELQNCAQQPFDTLSGGQQARFQILLLELSGATLLLLDEPTDNLDLVSAEALEAGLAQFDGTVVAVTHDRWFLRGFDRYVIFGDDCAVTDRTTLPPTWL
ncbi:MAG: ABC-F family ATP-binding cassette domain-containing protein [Actinobacteria bacterium]|nr:ABC-F family ATP-binding cassette domain-containing protein [Actinomycetota bacterium]